MFLRSLKFFVVYLPTCIMRQNRTDFSLSLILYIDFMYRYSKIFKPLFTFFNLFPLTFGVLHLLFSIFPLGKIDPNIIFIGSFLINLLVYFKIRPKSILIKIDSRFLIFSFIYSIITIRVVYLQFLNLGGDYLTHINILKYFALSYNDEGFGMCCFYPSGAYGISFFIPSYLQDYRVFILMIIAILFLFINLFIYLSSFDLLISKNYYLIFAIFPFFYFFFSLNGLISNLTALSFSFWLANQTHFDSRLKILLYVTAFTIHPAVLFYYPNLLLISKLFSSSSISFKSLKSFFVFALKIFVPFSLTYILFSFFEVKMGNFFYVLQEFFKDYINSEKNLLSILNFENFTDIPRILTNIFMYPFFSFSNFPGVPMAILLLTLWGLSLTKKPFLTIHFCILFVSVLILNSGYGGPFNVIRIIHFPVYAQSHRAMPLIFTYILIGIYSIYDSKRLFSNKSKLKK